MSFQEIMISIAAENLASAEFHDVSADAARMGTQVSVASSEMASGFQHAGAEAVKMGSEIGVASHETSARLREVGVSATEMGAQVKASAVGFTDVQRGAEATTVSLRTTAMAFASVGMMGSMIISVADDFGVLDREAAKQTRTFLHLITLIGAIIRVKHYLATVTGAAASAQSAHTATMAANTGAVAGSTAAHTANASAVAGSTAAKTANVGATISSAIAEKVHAAANLISAKATWVLNAALAMKIALLTLGVGLIAATAAYMAWLASTTRDAAEAQIEYNESLQYRQRVGRSKFEEEQYERITRRGGYG